MFASRLRLDHTNNITRSYILKILPPPPLCPTCNILITIHHIPLDECVQFDSERSILDQPPNFTNILPNTYNATSRQKTLR